MMNISFEVGNKCARLGLWPEAITEYVEYINRHVHYVQQFGVLFGVPDELLSVHDESKWSVEEFPHYCQKFYGGGGNDDEFAMAWLHHENANPHHWGHWIARSRSVDISYWINKAGPMMNLHADTVSTIHAIMKGIGYISTGDCPFSFSLSQDSILRLSKAVRSFGETI